MSAPELAPGQIVAGTYSIRSLLARSETIATYHAMTAPNRQVALKLYDPSIKSFPEVLKTLGRYQMTTAALASKMIAPIVEIGEDPGLGAPYTVTDFEPNPSLADLVDLCPLSIPETVTLITHLARSVDLLHAHGIVHLALHPRNVFVGPAPGYEVRILDFSSGVVRKALGVREHLQQTAPWLSPDQLKAGEGYNARTDVFAAALVAFFAATGRSYWRSCPKGDPDVAEWQREVVGARMPASQRAHELDVAMSPAFDAVFARALAVSPMDRFASVGEFATALSQVEGRSSLATIADATDPAFVPPPPAQMEAVLNAFEGGGGTRRPTLAPSSQVTAAAGEALTSPTSFVLANDADVVDDHAYEGGGKRAARMRVGLVAAIVGVVIGMIGMSFALFSGKKSPATRPTELHAAAQEPPAPSTPIAATSAAAIAPAAIAPVQEPVAANESPEPAALAEPPSPLPTASASPPDSTPAARPLPARAPAWRRPAPKPPAKKPCGKFLKRCN